MPASMVGAFSNDLNPAIDAQRRHERLAKEGLRRRDAEVAAQQ